MPYRTAAPMRETEHIRVSLKAFGPTGLLVYVTGQFVGLVDFSTEPWEWSVQLHMDWVVRQEVQTAISEYIK